MSCDSEVNSLGTPHRLALTSFPTTTPSPLPGVNHFQSIPPPPVGRVAEKATGSCWYKVEECGGGTLDMRRHAAVNRDALGGSLNSRQSQSPAFALTLMRKCRLLGTKKKKTKNPVTTAAATDVYNLPLASCSSGLQPSLENKLSSIPSDAEGC